MSHDGPGTSQRQIWAMLEGGETAFPRVHAPETFETHGTSFERLAHNLSRLAAMGLKRSA